jgi:hypothetical protein
MSDDPNRPMAGILIYTAAGDSEGPWEDLYAWAAQDF